MSGADLLGFLPSPNEITNRIEQIAALGDRPILLYGAGGYSNELRGFLESLELEVVAHVVDDEFLGDNEMPDKRTISGRQASLEFSSCRLIVAFTIDPADSLQRAARMSIPGLESIELIDCWRWESFAGWRSDVSALADSLQSLYEALDDDRSRSSLVAFLRAKLLLHPGSLREVHSPAQYFPVDVEEFTPRSDDVFIDGGAYTGDTLADFVKRLPTGCRDYLAFEPDRLNRLRLEEYVSTNQFDWVSVLPFGLWNARESVGFGSGRGAAAGIDEVGGVERVAMSALDDFKVEPTAIKLDIEGAESKALEGAASSIASSQPRLSVAAYHRPDDLLILPDLIRSLGDYSFSLRQHDYYSNELILYASTRA